MAAIFVMVLAIGCVKEVNTSQDANDQASDDTLGTSSVLEYTPGDSDSGAEVNDDNDDAEEDLGGGDNDTGAWSEDISDSDNDDGYSQADANAVSAEGLRTVEFEFYDIKNKPGEKKIRVSERYVELIENEDDRYAKIKPTTTQRFTDVVPEMEYYVNFKVHKGLWVADGYKAKYTDASKDHVKLNAHVRMRVDGGPWEWLSDDLTQKTGKFWNLQIYIP